MEGMVGTIPAPLAAAAGRRAGPTMFKLCKKLLMSGSDRRWADQCPLNPK